MKKLGQIKNWALFEEDGSVTERYFSGTLEEAIKWKKKEEDDLGVPLILEEDDGLEPF